MRALLLNLVSGLRLATFQRVAAARFRVSIGQLALLTGIDVGLAIGIGYFGLDGAGYFNANFLLHALASVMLTLGVAALLAAWARSPTMLLGYAVAATAMSPALYAYAYASRAAWTRLDLAPAWGALWVAGWLLLVGVLLLRAAALWAPLARRTRVAMAVFLMAALGAQMWMFPSEEAWFPASPDRAALDIGRHEAMLYRQAPLLDQTLKALHAQRPHVSDLYFVGFAGYGWQDVFMKEVNTVRALFDARYGTRGRSVVLINNARTAPDVPIASTTALETTLRRVGALMDPAEDLLFLFVTSHGAMKPAYVSVSNAGLDLTQLTPARLQAALAATPIKWKVVVVSACYSGGFVPALRDDNSLIITASSAERNSFGCDDRNSMTDFGRAYFEEALAQTRSFTAAFELARNRIAVREQAEGLTPSQPQIAVGKNFAAHWRDRF
jgi:hypothetical protein